MPDRAALAPAKVNRPPCFRCRAARWLEIVEVHTLCFHIRSVFLYKSKTQNQNSAVSYWFQGPCSKHVLSHRPLKQVQPKTLNTFCSPKQKQEERWRGNAKSNNRKQIKMLRKWTSLIWHMLISDLWSCSFLQPTPLLHTKWHPLCLPPVTGTHLMSPAQNERWHLRSFYREKKI